MLSSTPLLKKGIPDSSQLKSYRPMPNLPFLSKLLEKVIHNQLQHCLIMSDAVKLLIGNFTALRQLSPKF